jgi:glycosyltransferase involved in cell wall biosynthesis
MKILYLLSQVPGSTGSGVYTRAMIRQAEKAGHQASLVAACSAKRPMDGRGIGADSIHWVIFDQEPLLFPIPGMSDEMPYPSTRFRDMKGPQIETYEEIFERVIRGAVQKKRPDIIHSNHLWLMSALARRAFPEIPLVVTCHGTELRQFQNVPRLTEKVVRDIPKVDMVLALGLGQKREIQALYGMDGDKIHVAHNGFDPALFYPSVKTPPPPFSLLYAGKISAAKGLFLLLETLAHDRLRHLPIELFLAGSGSEASMRRLREAAKNAPGKITVLGAIPPRDLGALMRKAHLFVLPSFFEGSPLVIIEALASGCSVVASDLPGIRELVSGLVGDWGELFHLPPLQTVDRPFESDLPRLRDILAEALARQMEKCTGTSPQDSGYIESIQGAYGWERVFHRTESLYRSLI